MELLDLDNIFTDEEVGKILGEIEAEPKNGEQDETNQENEEPVVEDLDSEFLNHDPESVGNTESPSQAQPSSPANNLFTSIAKALREEGVFPDLDDETLKGITDAGSFRKFFDNQIDSRLDERQKRVSEALDNGVQPSEVQGYENAIAYLNGITDEALSANNEQGEEIRKRLIYQDLINRGYSQEKAVREVKKSLDAATDIDDARDALVAAKEFFTSRYKAVLDNAKSARQKAEDDAKKEADSFKKSIMEDKKFFGSVEIDNDTRRRVFDTVTKPVKKDENGKAYTELQWYQKTNPTDFIKNLGLMYVLTDGFKNLDQLIGKQVKQETAKGLRGLEQIINNTQRNPDGSLKLMSGVSDDPESFFGEFELDV